MNLIITVRATPRPGGSKIAGFNHTTGKSFVRPANKHTATWRQDVRNAALLAYRGQPEAGAMEARYVFLFNRPASHFGTGKNKNTLKASAPQFHTKKPDLTKLIRSTEDALTGIIWVDDSQVCRRTDEKKYISDSEFEGVVVTIRSISEN